jgi:long-chain acyl-CoA synthetase
MFDPDGHLVVIDRAKDVTSLTDGTKFAPQYIENKLKFSAYIKEAVAIGQDRPYVVAMVNIDMDNVGKWAERRQIAYTTYTDLAQKPEVYDLILREVERVNRDVPEATRIAKYVLLHKELDPDDEEVTRTRKVRRKFVGEKYAPIIEALYSDAERVPVTSVITYQDGRQATIQTHLAIRRVVEVAEAVAA